MLDIFKLLWSKYGEYFRKAKVVFSIVGLCFPYFLGKALYHLFNLLFLASSIGLTYNYLVLNSFIGMLKSGMVLLISWVILRRLEEGGR